MAKRMFNKAIVQSDAFLDMPLTSQALYFHLSMHADDYGFVSPKYVMRTIGANDDDLKILIAKRYVLTFESGVVVIKHWQINNTIRKDRSHPTTYKREFDTLIFNEFGAYTERRKIISTIVDVENATTTNREEKEPATKWQPNGNQMATENRIEQNRIVSKTKVLLVNSNKSSTRDPNTTELLKLLIKTLGYSEQTRLTDGRKAKLKARLRLFKPEELLEAAKNLSLDAYMQGDNDGGKKYGNIDYLLRSDEVVDKWLEAGAKTVNFKAGW